MDSSENATSNNILPNETKQELLNDDDTWIKDYLVPKLINDGKIFSTSQTVGVPCENINVNDGNVSRISSDKRNQIQVVSVNVKPVSLDGFMLSAPCKVEIEFSYERNGDKCEGDSKTQQVVHEKLYLVVKKTPNVPKDVYIGCQFDFLFQNELIAYTEIIPLLSQAKKYPRFYYSERKELSAVCVLEDFSQYGWRSARQLYNLPLQHILMAVRELATFHGEMYALKSSNLKLFNSIVVQLKEARIANGNIVDEYTTQLVTCRLRVVNAANQLDSEKIPSDFLEMFLKYTADPYTCFKRQFEPKEPLAVITHGDYLRNNIAYKFNENDEPTDVMMYDFQTMRYASPMLDLTLLLNVSASHEIRFNHFDQIFKLYHETLVQTYCEKLKLDAKEIPSYLSFESLSKEYVYYIPNSIMIAASFLPLLYTPMETNSVFELHEEQTHEEIVKDAMERGGALLDKELAYMMLEFYQLCNKFQIKFN